MTKTIKLLMLLSFIALTACTDNDDNADDNRQTTAVDAGPSYTDKTVDVNRDGCKLFANLLNCLRNTAGDLL